MLKQQSKSRGPDLWNPQPLQRISPEDQGLRGGRVVRRLLKKPPTVILLFALIFPHSHLSLENKLILGVQIGYVTQ